MKQLFVGMIVLLCMVSMSSSVMIKSWDTSPNQYVVVGKLAEPYGELPIRTNNITSGTRVDIDLEVFQEIPHQEYFMYQSINRSKYELVDSFVPKDDDYYRLTIINFNTTIPTNSSLVFLKFNSSHLTEAELAEEYDTAVYMYFLVDNTTLTKTIPEKKEVTVEENSDSFWKGWIIAVYVGIVLFIIAIIAIIIKRNDG